MEGLREEEEAVTARARTPAWRGRARALAIAPGLAMALALAGAAGDARADDQQQAEELFERGRKLMQSSGTLDEACRTLQESLRLWDRGDTVLNLAECHRRQGKTATAWAEFDKAINHGTKVHFPEAVETAKQLRDMLAAKLSTLTVTVPPAVAALDEITVEVGGNPFPRERWNTAFVIDPGPLKVSAHAKGHKPFEARVEIGASKDTKTVVVALEAEPPPPPPTPPPVLAPVVKPAPRPVWPWVVGGAGLVLGAAAIGSEVVSVAAGNELNTKCGADRKHCQPGYDFNPARTRELVGFGLFVGLGAASLLALGTAGVGLGVSWRGQATTPATPGASLVVSPTSIAVRSSF
jgi:hypothetical protein